jgi:ligand-binding sensor domain-containing protein
MEQLTPAVGSVQSLAITHAGLVAGTVDGLFLRPNDIAARFARWKQFDDDLQDIHGEPPNISEVFYDSHKNLWVGTMWSGVLRYSLVDGKTQRYQAGDGIWPLETNTVLTIREDASGRICFGTDQGMAVLSSGAWQRYCGLDSGLLDFRIYAMEAEEGGRGMWIGTTHAGLHYFRADGTFWATFKGQEPGGNPGMHFQRDTSDSLVQRAFFDDVAPINGLRSLATVAPGVLLLGSGGPAVGGLLYYHVGASVIKPMWEDCVQSNIVVGDIGGCRMAFAGTSEGIVQCTIRGEREIQITPRNLHSKVTALLLAQDALYIGTDCKGIVAAKLGWA